MSEVLVAENRAEHGRVPAATCGNNFPIKRATLASIASQSAIELEMLQPEDNEGFLSEQAENATNQPSRALRAPAVSRLCNTRFVEPMQPFGGFMIRTERIKLGVHFILRVEGSDHFVGRADIIGADLSIFDHHIHMGGIRVPMCTGTHCRGIYTNQEGRRD